MPDTLDSILEEYRLMIISLVDRGTGGDFVKYTQEQVDIEKDKITFITHQKIEELMLSEEDIFKKITSMGYCPDGEGDITYSPKEMKRLSQAIHNSMLKKLKES